MSDALIEAVARAMASQSNNVGLGGCTSWGVMDDTWQKIARAAVAAIEASGTHVLVPVEKPTTDEMTAALAATNYRYFGDYPLSEGQWDAVSTMMIATRVLLTAILAARSKVTT